MMNFQLPQVVKWLFEPGEEEEEALTSDEEEEGSDDEEADSEKQSTKRASKRTSRQRNSDKRRSKRTSSRSSIGKMFNKSFRPKSILVKEEDSQVGPRASPSSKRSSKRISFRNSFGRKKESAVEKSARSQMISNLGAIDENGEYKQAKLEDSNIAGLGSKEDRDLRKAAAASDPQFKNAGKKVGIEIWRVENKRTVNDCPDFGIKRVNKADYGNFYTGDSYIVLNTYPADKTKKGGKNQKLLYDVHFWLGAESTQDEIGVAAYKTVELDTLLNDDPIQHRETQYHESKLFLSYFKELNYLEGGHESGFRKVKRQEEYEPRLLMVRQTGRNTTSYQIPCKSECMNHGDVFILDAGSLVYCWQGEDASYMEKHKGRLLQHNIASSRHGKSKKAPDYELDDIWKILGPESNIRRADDPFLPPGAPELLKDKQAAKHGAKFMQSSCKLWRISDASGELQFTKEETEGEGLYYQSLDPNDVFLIESNIGIWVWIGNGATKQERSKAMPIADKYIKDNNLPTCMPITSITQDKAETNLFFRQLFVN